MKGHAVHDENFSSSQDLSDVRADVKQTLKRLDLVRADALPIDTLRDMQKTIRSRYSRLAEETRRFEESSNAAMEKADPDLIGKVKSRSIELRKEFQSLEELDQTYEDAIQKQIMRDRMVKKLGSNGRLLAMEGLVLILIVLVLGLLVFDIVAGPNRPLWLSSDAIFLIDAACCLVFMFEFCFRMHCADSRSFVWRHYWIDFVTSIPIPGEAQLARFGRIARVAKFAKMLRLLRLLRFMRLFFLLWRGMDKLQGVIDVKLMKRTLRWATVITLLGAFLVYKLEGLPGQSSDGGNAVGSFPLALWWSFTTVVTGGFGDIYNPESIGGQILTAILIVTGMVLIGVFTATLTSLFVGEHSEEIKELQEELVNRLDRLSERMDSLDENGGSEN